MVCPNLPFAPRWKVAVLLAAPLLAHSVVLPTARAAGADLPLHQDTVIRLAGAREAAELLGSRDTFIDQLSRFDRQSRLRSAEDVSVEQFLGFARQQALDWTEEEREKLEDVVRELREDLEPLRLPLPSRILLIKTTGREEGDAAYTRQNAIILPRRKTAAPRDELRRLLLHELFHVLSRHAPQLRRELYKIVGFEHRGPIVWPSSLRERKITNPDAPLVEDCIRIEREGRTVSAVPILFAEVERYTPDLGGPFFRFLEFRLLVVQQENGRWEAVEEDGRPVLVKPSDNESYMRQIGRNTGYIIHPDEILADNFVLLVLGETDLKTPRIVERMRPLLR